MKHEGTNLKQKTKIHQATGHSGMKKSARVCTLINSIFYFVGNVFIADNGDTFRLIAYHNGDILIDQSYPTLRGAKIAFSKLFGYRSWRNNVRAEWSKFYSADISWLDVKTDMKDH